MSAKTLGSGYYGEAQGLRPDTKLHRWPINFIFNDGGMGDFVNYAAATLWVAKNCPWVDGRLFVPRYLVPFMKDVHACAPNWAIYDSENASELIEFGSALIGPGIHMNGANITPQYLTVLGAHPVDVGFAYYAGSCPAPADLTLPMMDYPRDRLVDKVRALEAPYVVITTGSQGLSRRVTGKHLNPIIEHVKRRGRMPVFLGRRDLLRDGKATTTFPDDVDYHEGLDLRDETTVKQAACVLQHADATVGLDSGLLHLAAMMKDSRVVFGYNITSVAHREPRRNWGRTVNVTVSEDELKCIGCQSKLKNIAVHKFDKCIYGDSLCVDLLFKDGAARWIAAIDEILEVS